MLAAILLTLPAFASDFSAHLRPVDPPKPTPPLVFEDAAGAQHALSDYRGSFVLLNVWATWCGPCVKEMPSLDALQKNFDPKKLRVVPVSEDRGDDLVSVFYKTHALAHLPVAVDHAGVAPAVLHLRGLPTTLLIDPQGFEIARVEGDADWASPEVADFLSSRMR